MSAKEELADRARFLRNAAPQAFTDFHAAFAKYTFERYGILVGVADNWQLYQGHAAQCKAILEILEGAKNG